MPRVAYRFLLIALVGFGQANRIRADDELSKQIKEFIDRPEYRQARWGILIVDAKTGKTVFERDSERLFTPASTTKLFSCAAALLELGPDFRFHTPVYRRGDVRQGVLEGDLILVASGDLTFGGRIGRDGRTRYMNSDHTYANGGPGEVELTDTNPLAAIEDLARQVAASGITEVKGEILIDERLFERARGTGTGPEVVSSIIVNDNVIDVIVTPAKRPGDRAQVRIRPETSFIRVESDVLTAEKGKPASLVFRSPSPGQYSLRGVVPIGSPVVRNLQVDEPVLFARALLIEALRRQGVRVQAGLFQPDRFDLPERTAYANLPRVALWQSAPLAESIEVTLKVSHNLYANTLPLLLAAKHEERTLEKGLRRQRKILKDLGVPVETLSFSDGAGGANADAVTPAATVKLLQAMAARPEADFYFRALPVLGVDGTLAEVVGPESPARGKVAAKTGTLVWFDLLNERLLLRSKALAGVLETAQGTRLYFAIFLNDLPLAKGANPTSEGKNIGKLCELIHRFGP